MNLENALKSLKNTLSAQKISPKSPFFLIVVSKYRTLNDILDFKMQAQQILLPDISYMFGENYVQEAQEKATAGAYAGQKVALIGYLQSNKAKDAAALFDEIHSIHSIKLAKKLNAACEALNKNMPIMIQVNLGNEPQKSGCAEADMHELILYIRENCSQLILKGMMIIPPAQEDPALYFKRLKQYAGEYELPHISMGMSSDWEMALAEGATHIRLGTALFGKRPPKNV